VLYNHWIIQRIAYDEILKNIMMIYERYIKYHHNILNERTMTPLFYKSLTTAVIITVVFLAMNYLDVHLEENYDMTKHQKNFLKAPVQFLLLFGVSMTVMYLFSQWFHVKQQ